MLVRAGSNTKDTRGDSLIEVLLAITVLSSVLYIAWATVNRASQIGLNAQRRIIVVDAVKEQAELVKAKYTNGPPSTVTPVSSPAADIPINPCEQKNNGIPNPIHGFYVDANASPQPGLKQIAGGNTPHVWVQVHETPRYYDYYVRACWQSFGGVQSDESSHLVVRINK